MQRYRALPAGQRRERRWRTSARRTKRSAEQILLQCAAERSQVWTVSCSWCFSPHHAQPCRSEGADRNSIGRELGQRAKAPPIFADKGASNGNGTVVLHKPMQSCESGEGSEEMVWDGSTRKIIDEPAHGCMQLHPAEETHHIFVAEMVCKQGAHDEVKRFFRDVRKDIAAD